MEPEAAPGRDDVGRTEAGYCAGQGKPWEGR
jgi:hypothetical protein